jgi:3-oxoacyl-[acyl-carrier-protein] synthase II
MPCSSGAPSLERVREYWGDSRATLRPMHRRRVVITGLGPISAVGVGVDALWTALVEGRSALKPIARFDASAFPCKHAGELSDEQFSVRNVVPKSYRKNTKVMARDMELAVGAADAAVRDAGLTTIGIDPDAAPTIPQHRFGCHIGAGLIAADVDELTAALYTARNGDGKFDVNEWGRTGMNNLTPLWLLKYLPNMLACHVTIIHGCKGPSNTITCSDASSGLSIGESMRVIERGDADACLSGGAEYKHNHMGLLRQTYAKRLAETQEDEDGGAVVRPFDREARGTLLGEGGGILVLEAEESARARGASVYVYAVVSGFGSTQSFCPDTVGIELDPTGEGIADAISVALESAKLTPSEIDAIVPMGTGAMHIDAAEAAAIKSVFGDRARDVPMVTTTPNVGLCCAGNGAIQTIAAAKALREQRLPARMNTINADGLNAAKCESKAAELRHMLVVSTSLGGQNVALVLSQPPKFG